MLLKTNLNDIYAPIDRDLKLFSEQLKEALVSTDPLICQIHSHLLAMSGKFLRPALTILCSKIEGKENPRAARLAVAIELIHTATLIHDDIIDDANLRRNMPSIYSKWGSEISIVSGDYLYAKAFLVLADLGDPWINQTFAACAHVICEGEMKQIEKRKSFLISEAEYLDIIHQKTASLFQAACMGGAYLSGTHKANINLLGEYGRNLGMAFQIVDDCLDLIGETKRLGKTPGLDITKNDVTLPLLYLFQSLGDAERLALLAEVQNDGLEAFEKIKTLAVQKKSIAMAMRKANEYIERAVAHLIPIKDSDYKKTLALVSDYCANRVC
ncbi:MAG: hypothetical protein COT00_01640 [Candidatus Omnitrophica bacterium CG07_land_8_20_14_0_80_50_8]|nr:MAG: hypothetical protein COT00_01640 [Candidatus Omnitrophica bacterium CG07_land_8_20_14_0_80_50_8]